MLHVRRVDRREEFDSLGAEWNALLDPSAPRAVFSRHEWLRAWFEAFGSGSVPNVLIATRGGALQGLLPLRAFSERVAGMTVRRLDLMANGHSPCADLVARAGGAAEVAAAFAQHLQETDPDWDLAVLPEVESGSALDALHDFFPTATRLRQPQRRAPYIELGGGDWVGYVGSLSRNSSRALRHNRNRVARAGTARVELLDEADAVAAALADVFAIGSRSWQGRAGWALGSTPENRRFYAGIVRELAPEGLVRLWFLRLAGRRVAFELHVVHAGVEFGLKTGYDLDHAALGIGRFLDQSILERLFAERRVREYDLLGDSDSYKLRWTARGRVYVRLTLFGSRAPSRLLSLWNLKLKPALRQARALARGPAGTPTPAAAGTGSGGKA